MGQLADGLAIAVAVALPWSSSVVSIMAVLWLLALLPTLKARATQRELSTLARGVLEERMKRHGHDMQQLMRSVITLGSPIVGGPKYTAVGRIYAQQGVDLDALEAEIEGREATPIRVPITAIWSRADGIVAWQACVDRRSPDVENVEVVATHLGLGFAADVYRVIAERLPR